MVLTFNILDFIDLIYLFEISKVYGCKDIGTVKIKVVGCV